MKKIKQIAIIILGAVLFIGLLISMGFVNKQQDSLLCKSLNVKINQDDELYFLDKFDVAKLIKNSGDSIIGQPKSTLNIPSIEKGLNSHEDIANAEVCVSIDGIVNVDIKQRKPILRIVNAYDESYYIDDESRLMPLSEKYTPKVIVANGFIEESYSKNYNIPVIQYAKDSLKKAKSMLDELYAMANFINADEFWKAQISQIYINEKKDMELIPMVGNQKIVFGDTSLMNEKFEKLLTFYQQGLNTTGWWDKYSTINLKFKNQIVCTKK